MDSVRRNLVGGEWIAGLDASEDINPSNTDDIVGTFAHADTDQVDAAVAAAKAALRGWARTTVQARHDILKRIGDELAARREELGQLLAREEGKTLAEGIGEAYRAAQLFHFYAGECLRIAGEKVASIRASVEIDITREPVGVIGLITPWNFPIAIPAWKIAPALAYGNTVIFKPAELVPATAHALAEVIARSGAPAGVFNLVMGSGASVGQRLLDHPDVAAISFTGSVDTGRHVAQSCMKARPMKKIQLELGGKNPLVVLDDADMAVAVECAVNGAFFSTGQRCTATSRIIVTEAIHDRFLAALKKRMEALVVDDACKAGTDIGPVVDRAQFEQDLRYIELGKQEGATLVAGGDILRRGTPGFYLAPALFSDVGNGMRIAQEEIFGPVASLIRVKDYEEALHTANDTTFGLSSGICTSSLKLAADFRRNSEAGMVMVNLPTAGVDYHVPFGGRKGSSYGSREQGRYALEFYTAVKTSYVFAG